MSFLKKVASAFVEIQPAADAEEGRDAASPAQAGIESMTQDAAQLLTQLDSGPRPPADAAVPGGASSMTADEVFRAAGIDDGPASSQRLLKMVAGLSMFPKDQQLAMVRAMDAADDHWSEPEVLADADRRRQALRAHLERITAEANAAFQALADEAKQTRDGGAAVIAEIDRRMAELQQRREQEAAETATAISRLEASQQRLLAEANRARRSVGQVTEALEGLVAFFAGGNAPQATPRGK